MYCVNHLEIRKTATQVLRMRRQESGLCIRCKAPADAGASCVKCWTINVSVNVCGDTSLRLPLFDLLKSQDFRCVYSGRILVPAVNANVDHIIPKFQGGSDDIDNLQWVDKQINRMKTDMSHQEFVAMCRFIAGIFP